MVEAGLEEVLKNADIAVENEGNLSETTDVLCDKLKKLGVELE